MATNRLESQQCNPYCWSKTLRHCINSLSKVQKVGQIATQTPLIHNVARAFNACTNLERDCDSMKPCSVEIPDSLGQNWSKRQPTRFLSRYFHSAIAACHLMHQGARSVERKMVLHGLSSCSVRVGNLRLQFCTICSRSGKCVVRYRRFSMMTSKASLNGDTSAPGSAYSSPGTISSMMR